MEPKMRQARPGAGRRGQLAEVSYQLSVPSQRMAMLLHIIRHVIHTPGHARSDER